MKKSGLIIVIFAVVLIIFMHLTNNAGAKLCMAALIGIITIGLFHASFNSLNRRSAVYNIFISHSWSYSDTYQGLIELLQEDRSFHFIDHSVPKDHPIHNAPNSGQLYQAIKEKMAPCHIVIVLVGVYATYSTWINNEIYIAKHEFHPPKPVLAISPWGARRISDEASQHADIVVKWNTASITRAIRELTRQTLR